MLKMRFCTLLLLISALNSFAEKMHIYNLENERIEVNILNVDSTQFFIKKFNGKTNDSLRKKFTARTYELSNSQIILEFYDRQSVLIRNTSDLKKLENIRFVKNYVWNLKRNISYKIEISVEKGKELAKLDGIVQLKQFNGDVYDYFSFEVYQLPNGQILFFEFAENSQSAGVYRDIKTLASEKNYIEDIEYGVDDEYYMRELAKGNTLSDFDPNFHLVYPKYLKEIVQNHKLILRDSHLYVDEFWGNLYESKMGYWMLIDEVNQENGTGGSMPILSLRIYSNRNQVKEAERAYKIILEKGIVTEHFYQKISDEHGKDFPSRVDELLNKIPEVLNVDLDQLKNSRFEIIDEAINWNHGSNESFDSWFPSALAYYGDYYIRTFRTCKWESKLDTLANVWVPQITLEDGTQGFDMYDFYKDIYEGHISVEWAGDFNGTRKQYRKKLENSKKSND